MSEYRDWMQDEISELKQQIAKTEEQLTIAKDLLRRSLWEEGEKFDKEIAAFVMKTSDFLKGYK